MSKFMVSVMRIGYSYRDITLDAEDPEDAVEKAIDEAGSLDFSERDSEYEADPECDVHEVA